MRAALFDERWPSDWRSSSFSAARIGDCTVELQPEWLEFLRLLTRHGVRYLLVGGLAVSAHGRERFTKDLDIFVEPTAKNARRLRRVLVDFGFAKTARAWKRLAEHYQILTLGREPTRIDILTSIANVSFAAAWKGRVEIREPGVSILVIGLSELRLNKAATGRAIDLFDLDLLDSLRLARRPVISEPMPKAKTATPAAGRSRRKRPGRAATRSRTPGTRRR